MPTVVGIIQASWTEESMGFKSVSFESDFLFVVIESDISDVVSCPFSISFIVCYENSNFRFVIRKDEDFFR